MKKADNLREFISLRDSIIKEKAQIEARLRELNSALGEMRQNIQQAADDRGDSDADEGVKVKATPSPAKRGRGRGRRGPRGSNSMSLREAVLQVVGKKAMTKEEILEGVQSAGYKFNTKNPLNSMGVILYGKNPKFKNEGGRFRLA